MMMEMNNSPKPLAIGTASQSGGLMMICGIFMISFSLDWIPHGAIFLNWRCADLSEAGVTLPPWGKGVT